MLSGLGAVWQFFLCFAVYDVLGKIRIPCRALRSLLRQRHFSKRNRFVMPEIRSYRTDTRVRVAGDFRLSHRITNERGTFAVFSRLSMQIAPTRQRVQLDENQSNHPSATSARAIAFQV
jgi:hypothetical protein